MQELRYNLYITLFLAFFYEYMISILKDIAKEPLPRALILAQQYANMIESGKFSTVNELANYLKFDRSHVARTLSLVNLAPDIVMAIMSGKAPESVTLNKILYGLPDNWQEQHEFLGMSLLTKNNPSVVSKKWYCAGIFCLYILVIRFLDDYEKGVSQYDIP